ncbi:MAG: GAF domain-containing sensor histidine kinase [Thermoleophilaceae bacterium]
MPDTASSPRTDALDALVELLSELDQDAESAGTDFYDRICEAVCRLTSMERAGLMLYDNARKLVVPVGSHGLEPGFLAQVYGTLEETPIAQRALVEDRVVEVSEGLEREVPARYARFAGVTTLTCTPVSAGGRWLGVIFADRGGGHFTLTEEERYLMWTFGKTAALAASARIATSQEERARLLSARIDLAREVHERVMQRLFGISLALGSEHELSGEERRRCAAEMKAALEDLRTALARPLAYEPDRTSGLLRDELARLGRHYKDLPLSTSWEDGVEVPEPIEPLAQSVLAEALRNARKHARPSSVRVHVGRRGDAFVLEVLNDGRLPAPTAQRGAGMGLKLAALEALQRGGVLEFGPSADGDWRVRLMVPLKDER